MGLKEIFLSNLPTEFDNYKKLICENVEGINGDFSLPCFSLAKEMRKAPNLIAQYFADVLTKNDLIEKVEATNGYLNIFLKKEIVINSVLSEYGQLGDDMFKCNANLGKTICIDYSSANLAKYLHIGHLSTTILGECLARIFEGVGYKVVRINYVGDYGTPFGKIVSAFRLWGSAKDIELRGIDAIQDLYVRFCKTEGQVEYDEMARECFKKIEEKDPETLAIYNWIIDLSIKYNKSITSMLGVTFDDYNGERYYSEKMQPVIDKLEELNLLKDGEKGSKIIDLGALGVALIKKSDGSSLYATRDLAAAIDRYEKYKFCKNYYVTDVSQKLHFEQVFKILELMGYTFAKGCKHIYYGRIRLPEGKISSRIGKQALVQDIIDEAVSKAKQVIGDRKILDADEVARVVGTGAVVFSVTKNEKIKDTIFDLEQALNFEGDTSPYMQYTYARCASILRKAEIENIKKIDAKYLCDEDSYNLIKLVGNFSNAMIDAANKEEPNIICKYTMSLCKAANRFYTNQRVLTNDAKEVYAKCKVIEMAKNAIKFGLKMICIETVEQM